MNREALQFIGERFTGDDFSRCPIAACQDVDINVIISQLDSIAKKYNKGILKPTQLLKEKLDTCRKLNL